MSLVFTDESHGTPGKASAHEDIVEARFVELIPGERVVQVVEFETEDPAFAGAMTMTWSLATVPGGTQVSIVCDDVPPGIRKEDHDAGLHSTLENLATFTERARP